ncbi:hypothetical protein ACJDU8_25210 [Clostridium sp. WILCCON 0269]|uniref:Hydrogenase maturation nickel metallochaperone HypA n=1 Tax=Candidatus Clostridium eludens TaxID=3381663 RepID=A0ABW8SSR9_9CLOT|nr:hypothetical protein [Clostridium kluyveri]UZQ51157.1 hypothetical protein OP486_02975 [Clostridium kluyveri]
MHDIILLSKISQSLDHCCKEGKISKINKMSIIVNEDSHINDNNLLQYLKNYNENLIDTCTEISIEIGDLPDQTAIIKNIEGDSTE